MEAYEHRIINGILRELPDVATPGAAQALLTRDVEILTDSRGADASDLWPCVWALANVLSRQFTGTIVINSDMRQCPVVPASLSERIIFSASALDNSIRIRVGSQDCTRGIHLSGDARGNRLSFARPLEKSIGPAHPISCFALAGYLGFAALAEAVGIQPFGEEYLRNELELPFDFRAPMDLPALGIAFLGLGQIGQSYLALLYFIARSEAKIPNILLLDKDRFEPANEATQILLETGNEWLGLQKAAYLAAKTQKWGWRTRFSHQELNWGFRRSADFPLIAFLGFDNFEARRVALEGGFDWILEGGIGTSLARPRVTWNSLPPDRDLGRLLFSEQGRSSTTMDKRFFDELRRTPGECGWFSFNSVRASAPSMGLVVAAFVWAEALAVLRKEPQVISGVAYAWPSVLPYSREIMGGFGRRAANT